MELVRDRDGRIIGVGCWADGFIPLRRKEMTLDEEVRRNGLEPVYNRMVLQGNFKMAQELLDKYQQ